MTEHNDKTNTGTSKHLVKKRFTEDTKDPLNYTKVSSIIESIKEAEQIAEYIVKSDTFGKVFEKRNEDGEVIKNKHDIISAILIGRELGLGDMASIIFGKQLDRHAYFKVMKGRALGIDPITSLDVINVIPTKNGDIIHTGINVIASALLKNKIKIRLIEDAVKEYSYIDLVKNKDLGSDLKDDFYVVTPGTTSKEVTTAQSEGKILVTKKITDIRTTVELERENQDPFRLTYRRSQAIEAKLYRGINSIGEQIEGKDNWNNNLETMLRNRVITIAGRIYGADILERTYSTEEALDIIDAIHEDITDKDRSYLESRSVENVEL